MLFITKIYVYLFHMKQNKKLPKILGYEGVQNEDLVIYGCRTFTVDDYQKLYDILKKLGIKSYKLPAGEVKFEELEDMMNAIKS